MKPQIQRLSAILVAIIIGSTGVVFTLSHVRAAGASIYFSPASRSVTQGATTTFTVRANTGGASVDTAALTIKYDATKLEFAGVSAASSPISSPVATYSNSGDTITGAYYTTAPISGDIVLATVTFKARVSSGSATVQLSTSGTNGTLIASGGSDLGAALEPATVSFAAAPTTPAPSNPTPTPSNPTTSSPTSNKPQPSGGNTSSGGNAGADTPTSADTSSPSATTQDDGGPILAASDVIPELKVGVFDKKNKPLKNKEVTLHSEPQTVKTDGDGFAVFTDVPIGDHTLSYKLSGVTHAMPVYVANADAQTVVFDFAQRNIIIMWTILSALLLSVAALVVVLLRRSGHSINFPRIRPRGPKPLTGPLGPNGATDFASPKPHHWRSRSSASGMVVGGPDGVKTFMEDK